MISAEYFKRVSIITVEAGSGAKPQKAIPILQHSTDLVVRKARINIKLGKTEMLTLSKNRKGYKKRSNQKNNTHHNKFNSEKVLHIQDKSNPLLIKSGSKLKKISEI
jgi:hypothetical protein